MKKLLSSLLALTMALSLAVLPASALELEDAKKLLAIHYVDGVAPEVLELDSLDAILEAIGDPYTFYMTPEQYQSFNQSVNGRTVVGIGATVETAYDGGKSPLTCPRSCLSPPPTPPTPSPGPCWTGWRSLSCPATPTRRRCRSPRSTSSPRS